jgi:hypothetical protein
MNFKANINKAAMKKVLDKIQELSEPIGQRTAREVSREVVEKMREVIASGKSPILGNGSFEPYRGQYRARIQKYGRVNGYSKKLRPVNLTLSGKFLESLKGSVQKVKSGYAAVIGFSDKKSQKMEQGHREGANGQAERPVIPQSGEKFSTIIQKVYVDIINERIATIAKRK